MSDKERVLARWPDAVAKESFIEPGWLIFINFGTYFSKIIGKGVTKKAAWADAARNLERNND